jgi:uncharacterized protein YbjT (DUF2867 family)
MSKVFVAGASGNMGKALIDLFKTEGTEFVAGIHGDNMDFADQASMVALMEGCDKMFLEVPLMEGMPRFGHLAVEAAKQAGIEYIIQASRYAASSDAHWRLGRDSGMIDQFVEDSGIAYTILRPNTLMQTYTNELLDMVKSGVIEMPEEDATVSYLDARDVADVVAGLFKDPGENKNKLFALTGPEGLTQADVAAQISEATGTEVKYISIPEEAYIKQRVDAGDSEWLHTMKVSLTRVVKLGMAGNVTKAVEFLSGKPARTFAQFAADHAGVWK